MGMFEFVHQLYFLEHVVPVALMLVHLQHQHSSCGLVSHLHYH
jgi:hypothetical protein